MLTHIYVHTSSSSRCCLRLGLLAATYASSIPVYSVSECSTGRRPALELRLQGMYLSPSNSVMGSSFSTQWFVSVENPTVIKDRAQRCKRNAMNVFENGGCSLPVSIRFRGWLHLNGCFLLIRRRQITELHIDQGQTNLYALCKNMYLSCLDAGRGEPSVV